MLSNNKKLSKVSFFLFLLFSFLALGFTFTNSVSAYTSEDMPVGYRVLNYESDVNKIFGVDLETTIYFDTSSILVPYYQNNLTFVDSSLNRTYTMRIFGTYDSARTYEIEYSTHLANTSIRNSEKTWLADSLTFSEGVSIGELTSPFAGGVDYSILSFIYVKDIEEPSIIESILSLFNNIVVWIPSTILGLITLFYDAETGLTFLGALAVAGLAISVIFLLLSVIQNFLHFRG